MVVKCRCNAKPSNYKETCYFRAPEIYDKHCVHNEVFVKFKIYKKAYNTNISDDNMIELIEDDTFDKSLFKLSYKYAIDMYKVILKQRVMKNKGYKPRVHKVEQKKNLYVSFDDDDNKNKDFMINEEFINI